jgi:hypothetical protein
MARALAFSRMDTSTKENLGMGCCTARALLNGLTILCTRASSRKTRLLVKDLTSGRMAALTKAK